LLAPSVRLGESGSLQVTSDARPLGGCEACQVDPTFLPMRAAVHRLRILDLGCGRNNIARHYADEKKFTIQGYDHVAEEGSGALIGNIADLAAQEEDESADICIFSQSLMGSDWPNYLTEGHRMLRYNGEFIISEHIKMLDDVRAELGRLGCKVESVDADASATDTSATDADDKVAKWFVLVARKV